MWLHHSGNQCVSVATPQWQPVCECGYTTVATSVCVCVCVCDSLQEGTLVEDIELLRQSGADTRVDSLGGGETALSKSTCMYMYM